MGKQTKHYYINSLFTYMMQINRQNKWLSYIKILLFHNLCYVFILVYSL